MNSITFFLSFIPFLALILLSLNLIFAPHNSYQEKSSTFECGFHSFLGQNRTQFNISFFVFGLLFLLFDMELVLLFPGALSLVVIDIYGLILMLVFFVILTAGFAFELGKKALNIDSRQNEKKSNFQVEHDIYYNPIEYYIAIIYHYCKKRSTLNSIIFIVEKSISKFNGVILFFFLIIKEYISKFHIIRLIEGFIILKVITFMLAFRLYIFRIIENFDTVFTVASYLIVLLIAITFIRTSLKNIPKLFITLMLNSTVIAFIIILGCCCFNIEMFSYYTLTAFSYFITNNMGDDCFTLMNYHPQSSGPPGTGPSGGDPSGTGPGGPPGGGPNKDPFVAGSGQDSSGHKTHKNPDPAKYKVGIKWRWFKTNWLDKSIHTHSTGKVTKLDLINSLSEDKELRTKDSQVMYDAFVEIYRNKWPANTNQDLAFSKILELLGKGRDDAFKYKNIDQGSTKITVENAIKRIDRWTREEVNSRGYDYPSERLAPEIVPTIIWDYRHVAPVQPAPVQSTPGPWTPIQPAPVQSTPAQLPPTPKVNIKDFLN